MFCASCGERLPEGAKFCNHCGAPVAADPEVTSSSATKKTAATATTAAIAGFSIPAFAHPAALALTITVAAIVGTVAIAVATGALFPSLWDGGEGGTESQEETSPSEESTHDAIAKRLDGWWTSVGCRPLNPYVHFDSATQRINRYSHDGELESSKPFDFEYTRSDGRGWELTFGDDGISTYYVLRDSEDLLDEHWYNDDGSIGYSGSDSLTRCSESDPVPEVVLMADSARTAGD